LDQNKDNTLEKQRNHHPSLKHRENENDKKNQYFWERLSLQLQPLCCVVDGNKSFVGLVHVWVTMILHV